MDAYQDNLILKNRSTKAFVVNVLSLHIQHIFYSVLLILKGKWGGLNTDLNDWNLLSYLWCFLYYQKMCTLFRKNLISCLFLKNVSPSKRVICFILNNLHFPMVEGIAFYALHKSRVLIIPCKADSFCLFIGLADEI